MSFIRKTQQYNNWAVFFYIMQNCPPYKTIKHEVINIENNLDK